MAVKWETKISVLDPKRKNVSVTLQQIDDTDPENVKILKSFSVLDALINTTELKQQVIDELERQYNADKKKVIDDTATIGTLAVEIKTAAESWEAK